MARRSVAVLVETLEALDALVEDLDRIPAHKLKLRPHRQRHRLTRSRVTDEVIERGVRLMRREYGLPAWAPYEDVPEESDP